MFYKSLVISELVLLESSKTTYVLLLTFDIVRKWNTKMIIYFEESRDTVQNIESIHPIYTATPSREDYVQTCAVLIKAFYQMQWWKECHVVKKFTETSEVCFKSFKIQCQCLWDWVFLTANSRNPKKAVKLCWPGGCSTGQLWAGKMKTCSNHVYSATDNTQEGVLVGTFKKGVLCNVAFVWQRVRKLFCRASIDGHHSACPGEYATLTHPAYWKHWIRVNSHSDHI